MAMKLIQSIGGENERLQGAGAGAVYGSDELGDDLGDGLRVERVRGIVDADNDGAVFGKRFEKAKRAHGGLDTVGRNVIHRVCRRHTEQQLQTREDQGHQAETGTDRSPIWPIGGFSRSVRRAVKEWLLVPFWNAQQRSRGGERSVEPVHRNARLRDVLTMMERLGEAKISFRGLTEAIDTTAAAGRNDDESGWSQSLAKFRLLGMIFSRPTEQMRNLTCLRRDLHTIFQSGDFASADQTVCGFLDSRRGGGYQDDRRR
jgi:hypothetical protein